MSDRGSFGEWLRAVDGRAEEVSGPGRAWARNRVLLAGVGSTNAVARRVVDEFLGDEMELPPAVFVAWEQTAGRGRHGRGWASPAGAGAWVTMIRPLTDVAELAVLPLLVPLGLCEAVDRHLPEGRECRIKWPNDLVVGGRKVGGVLIDGVAPRGGEEADGAAVIGFGVNVLQDADALAAIGGGSEGGGTGLAATSLALERGAPVAVEEVLWDLVEAVGRRLAESGERAAAVADYGARSVHRPGDAMRCRSGEETLEGRFRGFDERGFLRLELTVPGGGREAGEEVLMRAGEVIG